MDIDLISFFHEFILTCCQIIDWKITLTTVCQPTLRYKLQHVRKKETKTNCWNKKLLRDRFENKSLRNLHRKTFKYRDSHLSIQTQYVLKWHSRKVMAFHQFCVLEHEIGQNRFIQLMEIPKIQTGNSGLMESNLAFSISFI